MLNSHYGNPAALVYPCTYCGAAPGVMCTGRADKPTYYYSVHKARQDLLEMPQDRAEWDHRMAMVRAACGR
jgi:hypothetical protein